MKFWTSGILMAIGALLPMQAWAQGPWGAPGAPPADQFFSGAAPAGYESATPPGYAPYGSDYENLLPADRQFLYSDDTRRLLSVREIFAESYVRLDYVNWNLTGSNQSLLGAPTLTPPMTPPVNAGDPTAARRFTGFQLAAVDPTSGPRNSFTALVPRIGDDYEQLNGLRGLVGFPTNAGTLEAEIFYFAQDVNTLSIEPFVNSASSSNPTTIAGMTLLNNGALSNTTMILFGGGYTARQKTSFWGTEANWVFKPFTPNVRVEWSPIIGFRYLKLEDEQTVSGQDTGTLTNSVTLNHYISSMANNNIFGPQIGLRSQTHLGRLELGAETKFVAGINSIDSGVSTAEIYNPTTSTDPTATTEAPRSMRDHRTRFAPVFDLALTGKFQMTDHFRLFASYEFLLGGGVSRSFNNVYYNAPSASTSPPQISLKTNLDQFIAHGFAVGGEFTFR